MYAFIRGSLVEVQADHLVVENSGIGYMIRVPFNAQYDIPQPGEEVLLHTYFHATESGVTLYGFFTKEDRQMFLSMTGVSGIGPKGAVSVLTALTSREIMFAILNDDSKAISKAPGIGDKTAKRMILELKDKLDVSEDTLLTIDAPAVSKSADSGPVHDAIMALNALGYGYAEAARAVKNIENAENHSVEELLSLALKEL